MIVESDVALIAGFITTVVASVAGGLRASSWAATRRTNQANGELERRLALLEGQFREHIVLVHEVITEFRAAVEELKHMRADVASLKTNVAVMLDRSEQEQRRWGA